MLHNTAVGMWERGAGGSQWASLDIDCTVESNNLSLPESVSSNRRTFAGARQRHVQVLLSVALIINAPRMVPLLRTS